MPVTTIYKDLSSNPVHSEAYSIQHYVKKIAIPATCRWFSLGTPISATNKTDRHDITEILLKLPLNTINHQPPNHLLTPLISSIFS